MLAGAACGRRSTSPPTWIGADRLDPLRDDLKTPPQLYNLDCVAYESLLLGLFTHLARPAGSSRADKPNEVCVGFSRDGFHWHRPDRRAFCPVSETQGDWNWGNVQSAGGCCLVVGDQLYFYVSGRAGVNGRDVDGGLAALRRDGFASMDAGDDGGHADDAAGDASAASTCSSTSTRRDGELRAEVLDEDGQVIGPFTRGELRAGPGRQDAAARCRGRAADLARWPGKPVRFRFHLRSGEALRLLGQPDESGASHGYVAAGGPGFTGPMDTGGRRRAWRDNWGRFILCAVERCWIFSGCNSHPATGSLQPVAIGAAVEVTKPSEPSRQTGRLAARRADRP